MTERSYILQLQKSYPDHLKQIIREAPFEIIMLRGGKKKPGTTEELHETIRSFLLHEKKDGKPGWVIEWEPWYSRKFGHQRWPATISILTEEDLLSLLSKQTETAAFRLQLQELKAWNSRITDWLVNRPLILLELLSHWKSICSVVDFLQQPDLSAYYVRNLPVPVHTKFIERHQVTLLSLLRHLQPGRFPAEAKELEEVLNLRKKPHLFPLRWLDKELARSYTAGLEILALPPFSLRDANWDIKEVWLVENETNLYLLPAREKALAVFSKGYALHDLKEIPLFRQARLFYWGDLDEDGFTMLRQFRSYYPHVQSVLMDERTVRFHQSEMEKVSWRFRRIDLDLQPAETAGYSLLLEQQGRIEQERLRQDFVRDYLADLLS